jgi:subtilase family serine protease
LISSSLEYYANDTRTPRSKKKPSYSGMLKWASMLIKLGVRGVVHHELAFSNDSNYYRVFYCLKDTSCLLLPAFKPKETTSESRRKLRNAFCGVFFPQGVSATGCCQKIHMESLIKVSGQHNLARLAKGVSSKRTFGKAMLSGVATLLMVTSGSVFAAMSTIEVSSVVSKSTLAVPLDGNTEIRVLFGLPSSDPSGLAAFVKQVYTPGDPLFHQYLTAQQFAAKFGGNEADYNALKAWAAANGLQVSQESLSRLNLTVRGNVSLIQKLFQTQLTNYTATDGTTFYSASTKVTVPAEIAAKVCAVVGLTSGKRIASMAKAGKVLGEEPITESLVTLPNTSGGTGPGGSYSATDLRTVYSIPNWGNLDKEGQTVAVFEQGYYHPSDVKKYINRFNVGQNTKLTVTAVDSSPLTIDPEVEPECVLDVDMVIGMNPDVAEVQMYVDYYKHDSFDVAIVDAFSAIAEAKNPPQIVSVSYGQDEGYFINDGQEVAEDTVLQQLASQGISVFASSGDNGAYGDGYYRPYNTENPASDPYVTGVGGTTLYTGPGEEYVLEDAWNELLWGLGATGGGISAYWPIPDYQQLPLPLFPAYYTANGGSSTNRNVPDVAADADPLTGVGIYIKDAGGWVQYGGTSLACPIWAGFLSNVSAAWHHFNLGNIGFFNPALYNIGGALLEGASYPALSLYGVNDGSNGILGSANPGYFNAAGYCNTTGNGSLPGGEFAALMMIGSSRPGTVPGMVQDFTVTVHGETAEFKWDAATGALGYALEITYAGPVNGIQKAYITKGKTLTVKGLPPIPKNANNVYYTAYLYSFNASGTNPSNSTNLPAVQFNTK